MMANEKYLHRYRISSARAPWHGYGGGIYFITICTAHRKHFFGKISDGEMHLSVMGKCLDETIRNVTIHYPYAEIPLFVIMPDHFHAIVIIDGDKTPKPTEPANGGDNGDTGNNGDNGDQLNHVYTGDARCCRDAACHVSTNGPTNANVVPNGSINANVVPNGSINVNVVPNGPTNVNVVPNGSINANVVSNGPTNANVVPNGPTNANVVPNGPTNANVVPNGSINANVVSNGPANANVVPNGPANANAVPNGTTNANVVSNGPTNANVIPNGPTNANVVPNGPTNANVVPNGSTNANVVPNGSINANVVPNDPANANGAHDVSTPMEKNLKMQGIANQCGWLSVCMGGIKSAVTKFAHAHHIEFAWQTRFHDHIIRDTGELDRIALYIKKNITQWESDRS